MLAVLIISLITIVLMILSIMFFPNFKIGNKTIQSYWIITIIGALILIIFGLVPLQTVINKMLEDSSINPIKILTLFISMTILSVFLDELGFFKYLATVTINKAKCKQKSIFLSLYVITSILTIFTSNDIIILTLTPFICYFCKNAKINPIPYLVSEFVSANTWSMMLIIGNPTNIFVSSASGIDFVTYLKYMILPTIAGGLLSFLIIYIIFNKDLKKDMEKVNCEDIFMDKTLLIIGIIHLALCTILLAISSYVGFEMWIITFIFAIMLLLISSIYLIIKRKDFKIIKATLKRAPWSLIPFLLSMFILVLSLSYVGISEFISDNIFSKITLVGKGLLSFLFSNLINNIPMCVLFSDILLLETPIAIKSSLAVIIGSNVGAFLTPIGALAGIMWMSILKENEVDFSFMKFIKYGILISIPTILISLFVLVLI